MKYLTTLVVAAFALMVIGCTAGDGYAAPKPDFTNIGPSGAARNDCNQIYGTPFRSAEERGWYEANCSKWPPAKFDSLSTIGGPRTDSPQCAAMRGRPYANDSERQWFQANCNPDSPGANDPAVFVGGDSGCVTSSAANATATPQRGAATGPSGNPANETNCVLAPQSSPTTVPGDRSDCQVISGTVYRSRTEQAWYESNCLGIQPGQPGSSVSALGTPLPATQQQQPVQPQYRYCNPTNPGYPNARGRTTPPC